LKSFTAKKWITKSEPNLARKGPRQEWNPDMPLGIEIFRITPQARPVRDLGALLRELGLVLFHSNSLRGEALSYWRLAADD
jgi:hypothetical protein